MVAAVVLTFAGVADLGPDTYPGLRPPLSTERHLRPISLGVGSGSRTANAGTCAAALMAGLLFASTLSSASAKGC
jgi:hypothetical protein